MAVQLSTAAASTESKPFRSAAESPGEAELARTSSSAPPVRRNLPTPRPTFLSHTHRAATERTRPPASPPHIVISLQGAASSHGRTNLRGEPLSPHTRTCPAQRRPSLTQSDPLTALASSPTSSTASSPHQPAHAPRLAKSHRATIHLVLQVSTDQPPRTPPRRPRPRSHRLDRPLSPSPSRPRPPDPPTPRQRLRRHPPHDPRAAKKGRHRRPRARARPRRPRPDPRQLRAPLQRPLPVPVRLPRLARRGCTLGCVPRGGRARAARESRDEVGRRPRGALAHPAAPRRGRRTSSVRRAGAPRGPVCGQGGVPPHVQVVRRPVGPSRAPRRVRLVLAPGAGRCVPLSLSFLRPLCLEGTR